MHARAAKVVVSASLVSRRLSERGIGDFEAIKRFVPVAFAVSQIRLPLKFKNVILFSLLFNSILSVLLSAAVSIFH